MTEPIKLFLNSDRQSGCPVPPYTEITPELARRIVELGIATRGTLQDEQVLPTIHTREGRAVPWSGPANAYRTMVSQVNDLLKENLALKQALTQQHQEIEILKAQVDTAGSVRAQEMATRQGWGRLGQTHLTNALDRIEQLTKILEHVNRYVPPDDLSDGLVEEIRIALNKDEY